jgi:DNA-binding response OmpR family regulator
MKNKFFLADNANTRTQSARLNATQDSLRGGAQKNMRRSAQGRPQAVELPPLPAVKSEAKELHVLSVGDDATTFRKLSKELQLAGMGVRTLPDNVPRGTSILQQKCDVIVMEFVGAPAVGLNLLKQIRKSGDRRPVLLILSRGGAPERIQGFQAGADDCVTAPWSPGELVARLRHMVTVFQASSLLELSFSDLTLNKMTRHAHRNGRDIPLTNMEFQLLAFLMESADSVCTREAIYQGVWKGELDRFSNIIQVYMQKLREKIDVGSEPTLLHGIRGEGYMLGFLKHGGEAGD